MVNDNLTSIPVIKVKPGKVITPKTQESSVMDNTTKVDWNDIEAKENTVCIVGAGFQKAVLREGLPSTGNIIENTVKKNGNEFPILKTLYDNKLSHFMDLNYIWKHIDNLSIFIG